MLVAYLPENEQIHFDANRLNIYHKAWWYNPLDGKIQNSNIEDSNSIGVFIKPNNWKDALLVLH